MMSELAEARTSRTSRRTAALTVTFVATFIATLGLAGVPPAVADADSSRLAGADRFETAVKISARLTTSTTSRVFVANGREFPDSLSGGAAAAHDGNPLLLVETDGVPADTAAEISRIGPEEIILLGGGKAVGSGAARELRAHAPVARWSGPDRYATSAAISRASAPAGANTVYVASGADYPDALTAGAVAGADGSPVLLVKPDAIPQSVRTELRRLQPQTVVIVGGAASVDGSVARTLGEYSNTVRRLAGEDRYATSVQLARDKFPQGATTVYLASGKNFPDALAGAPAARVDQAPMLLVDPSRVPAAIAAERGRLAPERVVALGGSASITGATLRQAAALAASDPAAQPGDGNRILAAPSASLTHLQNRARAMGATALFIDEMMPVLYRVGVDYGIDPTVMIAQSYHETGGGHFGRAVTPAHHNTCGLKVRDPGDLPDDHPDAHARFPSWEVGATAHAQHLYAYAGLPIPPGEVNVDPRWDWVYGRHQVTTVTELSTKWAPSPTYGDLVRNTALALLEG